MLALGLAALACAAAPALAAAPTLGGVATAIETAGGGRVAVAMSHDAVERSADTTFDRLAATRASTFVEQLAHVPLASVEWLRVDKVGTTGFLQLTEDDLRSGDAAFDAAHGNEVQFHWTPPDGTARTVTPASREDLHVTIRTRGGILAVTAGADRPQVDAGAPVVLTASAPGAPTARRTPGPSATAPATCPARARPTRTRPTASTSRPRPRWPPTARPACPRRSASRSERRPRPRPPGRRTPATTRRPR